MLFQTPVTIPIGPKIDEQANAGGFAVIKDIGGYVSQIVGLLLIVAGLAAFVYLVLGGIQWITAGGDKGKVEEARHRITNAVIGLAVTAVAWAIFLVLNYFFGLGLIGGGTTSTTTSPGNTTSNLANFTGLSACPCRNGGCAANLAVSRLSGTNDCRICKTTGWTTQGAPSTCNQVIACGRCP